MRYSELLDIYVVDFKPQLESLLADMVLVSEVANLAEAAENLQDGEDLQSPPKTKSAKGLWSDVNFEGLPSGDSEDEDDESDEEGEEGEEEEKKDSDERQTGQESGRPRLPRSVSSGSVLFKNRLEKWDEPKSKLDKDKKVNTLDCKRKRWVRSCTSHFAVSCFSLYILNRTMRMSPFRMF